MISALKSLNLVEKAIANLSYIKCGIKYFSLILYKLVIQSMILGMSFLSWSPRKMYKNIVDRIEKGLYCSFISFSWKCFPFFFFFKMRNSAFQHVCLLNFIFLLICFNREKSVFLCENDHLTSFLHTRENVNG